MITRPAAFRVFGEPAPKGSMIARTTKSGKVIVTEQVSRNKAWRRLIEQAAPVRITERPGAHQPLFVTLMFGVTRTTAAAAREYPATQSAQGVGGDLDKLVRLALDAFESCGVLVNDAQVVGLVASKEYADTDTFRYAGRRLGQARWAVGPGMYCRVEPVGWVPDPLPLVVPHG